MTVVSIPAGETRLSRLIDATVNGDGMISARTGKLVAS